MKLRKDEAQFRRQRIVELKQRDKSLTNIQLSELTGASPRTVIRTLNQFNSIKTLPKKN